MLESRLKLVLKYEKYVFETFRSSVTVSQAKDVSKGHRTFGLRQHDNGGPSKLRCVMKDQQTLVNFIQRLL